MNNINYIVNTINDEHFFKNQSLYYRVDKSNIIFTIGK